MARQLAPFLTGRVLEVGAGIGGMTRHLAPGSGHWTCLEPDAGQCRSIEEAVAAGEIPGQCVVVNGVLEDLPEVPGFDAILYVDVLEHIENDRRELEQAAARLNPGGHLVTLSPAHQWLFSPFDEAIGHHRRYNRSALAALTPENMYLVHVRHLDSVGMAASLANRMLLRQSMPRRSQIMFWDRFMVPFSRLIDPLLAYRVGKSILAVWRRDERAKSES